MKRIPLIAMAVLLSSCKATVPSKMYEGVKDLANLSVVTYQCDKACNKAIKSHLNFTSGIYGPHIMSASVQSINGIRGTNNHQQYQNVHNDSYNWGYEFHLDQGTQKFKLTVNHHMSFNLQVADVSFESQAGKVYFVGQVLKFDGPYTWTPVVVNITDNKVIYPENAPYWYKN